jgi:hypothetical protein
MEKTRIEDKERVRRGVMLLAGAQTRTRNEVLIGNLGLVW